MIEDEYLEFEYKPIPNCTEIEPIELFNREAIRDLGFLRSHAEKKIYKHKDKPDLYLEEIYTIDISVKDRAVRVVVVYSKILVGTGTLTTYLYSSQSPVIEDVKNIIDNYTV